MEEKVINFRSCFDVIGPIMIGPSSSHTAGALQIGLMARALMKGTPKKVVCEYYESFAQTHQGHGTDFAIIAGILGFPADDTRVPNAVEIAKEQGIVIEFIEKEGASPANHANTADITMWDDTKKIRILGVSVGGGTVEIRSFELENVLMTTQGTLPILVEKLTDKNGVSQLLPLLQQCGAAIRQINDFGNNQHVFRVFELQTLLSPQLKEQITQLTNIYILA